MVELQHRALPTPALSEFVASHPSITAKDFDDRAFLPVKAAVKADLNADQGGLCVYCECALEADAGQVEHIKPKATHPELCFTYTNLAASCIHPKTCGQKKKNGLLPIAPGPGCNQEWTLSTMDGSIEPRTGLTNQRRHAVTQTRDMLGLNQAHLMDERQRWLKYALVLKQQHPHDFQQFIQQAPYRHILATVLA